MADHVVGTMDTSELEKTYAGFVKVATWTVVIVLVVLVLIALFNA